MKSYLAGALLCLVAGISGAQVPQSPVPQPTLPAPVYAPQGGLDNNRTYQNSNGQTVHSPANQLGGGISAGATAHCMDGTYSFSQHRQGTCSGHGGVSAWL